MRATIRFFRSIWRSSSPSSGAMCEYQTARLPNPAWVIMVSRYSAAHPRTIFFRSLPENPLSFAAITKLAASRLTSHSNGPGYVSSKSLMSNANFRSGVA